MAELDMLSEILSNPEKLEQAMNLAKVFLGGDKTEARSGGNDLDQSLADFEARMSGQAETVREQSEDVQASAQPDLAGLLSAFGGSAKGASAPQASDLLSKIDPKFMNMAVSAMGEYANDDDKIQLLYALKPHLSGTRSDKVERAVQAFRISKTIKSVMRNIGSGGGENV